MKSITIFVLMAAWAGTTWGKLPALSDEAKAKAAEAAAKTAHSGKVDGFLLCKYQDKSAAHYFKTAKGSGKEPSPAVATPPCVDPGPFTYVPAGAAATPAIAAAPVPAAATAAADKDKKKP